LTLRLIGGKQATLKEPVPKPVDYSDDTSYWRQKKEAEPEGYFSLTSEELHPLEDHRAFEEQEMRRPRQY